MNQTLEQLRADWIDRENALEASWDTYRAASAHARAVALRGSWNDLKAAKETAEVARLEMLALDAQTNTARSAYSAVC